MKCTKHNNAQYRGKGLRHLVIKDIFQSHHNSVSKSKMNSRFKMNVSELRKNKTLLEERGHEFHLI